MAEIERFFLCFIPLFVAIDALGIMPIFISLTSELKKEQKKKLITDATAAALIISMVFLFAGNATFRFLGIQAADFQIAGGLILLLISVSDMAFAGLRLRSVQTPDLGIVPIGIPLMIGPAALTTIMILTDQYGVAMTLLALVVNLALVWAIFRNSSFFIRLVGDAGAKAFGKIMALFLAALAVMMIRVGLTTIIEGSG